MALKYCPRCGGQVTDRMAHCPHCGGALTQQPQLRRQPAKPGIGESMIAAVVALALSTAALFLWRIVVAICSFRLLGTVAGAALGYAGPIYYGWCSWLLVVGAVLCGLIPVVLSRKPGWQAVAAVGLAAVLIISGFLMFNFGFALGIRRDSFVQDAIGLIPVFRWCFVVAFPLVLVSLSIAGYGRRLKKALPLQLILLVSFLLLAVLLGLLLVTVFCMGVAGFSLSAVISGLLVLFASVLTGAGCTGLLQKQMQ